MTEKTLVLKKAKAGTPVIKKPVRKRASDPTVSTYRALMPLQVGTPNGVESRIYGDFVPEAETWPKIGIWLQTKRIEQVFVNQSEIDAWRERYEERTAADRAEKAAAAEADAEIARLQAQIREVEAKKQQALKEPDFNAKPSTREFVPDQTKKEPISYVDLGGVKFGQQTRAPQPAQNVAENRTRPAAVRRVVRKKV